MSERFKTKRQLRRQNRILSEALRLTHEYVGSDMLPPIAGWSWFDALVETDPEYVRSVLARHKWLKADQ